MTPDFDSRLREQFDAAPPDEVVPDFDAGALWPGVAEKIKRRSPVRIVLPWISHGAAVAAGLLLAWLVLPRGEEGTRVGASGVATIGVGRHLTTPSAQIAFPSLPEKVTVETNAQEKVSRAKRTTSRRATEASIQTKLPSMPPQIPSDDKQPTQSVIAAQSPQVSTPSSTTIRDSDAPKVSASSKQPAPVVVHLLDVNGESSERLRKPVEPLPARRMGFFARLLSRNKVPDLTGAAASDAMVQRTYLSR